MDKKYRYGAERKCIICGDSFKPQDKDYEQQCCSNKCRGLLQTRKATRKCAVCEKDFVPIKRKTCSRKCGVVYRLSRRTIDPMVKIRGRLALFCCGVIARCLRGKTDKTATLLGYSVELLRKHLEAHFEAGMSWGNYGNRLDSWSIDHTRPISSFQGTATIMEINSLSNLRPMWHIKNCSKSNKWENQ